MDLLNSPVFICGHPKAGTSLITALLDGHPAVVAYPEETLFFRRFLPTVEDKSRDEQIKVAEQYLIHIFEWNLENPPEHQKNYPDRDYSDISFEDVREKMIDTLPDGHVNPKDFLSAAVWAFGKVTGLLDESSHYWVEKSPYNEFYAETIYSWWPEAKCIHIVRDPRDNYVSYHRKHPDWTVAGFARNWVRSAQEGLINQDKFGQDRYSLIRFEDLLTNPEETLGRIVQFLDISWDEALLKPTRVGDAWRGNSMFEQKYQAINTDPIGRWKGRLSNYDLAMLQTICGQVMSSVGYEFSELDLKALSIWERAKLWREKVTKAIRRSK